MRILIAGATGKTGLRLTHELISRGHDPVALVRAGSDTGSLPDDVDLRQGDLTDLPEDVCRGCDAVVFAAGSGGSTGQEVTDAVDRDGAKRLIDLAEREGVARFVMLSSIGAGDPNPEGELAHYLKAKHDADEYLKASEIPHVILRPVSLTEEDGDRDVILGEDVNPEGSAARGDVAALLADAVDDPEWSRSVLRMQSV